MLYDKFNNLIESNKTSVLNNIKDYNKDIMFSIMQKLKFIGFINGNVIDGVRIDNNTYRLCLIEYYFELKNILKKFIIEEEIFE